MSNFTAYNEASQFIIENWELLDILINDLINKYNPFFDYKYQ